MFVSDVMGWTIKKPTSVTEAIGDEKWYNAKREKFQALKKNQTYELVHFAKGMSVFFF